MAKNEVGKKVLGGIGIGAAIAALILSIGAFAKANDVDKTKELSAFNYKVAGVNDNGTLDNEDKSSIVSDKVTVDGLTIDFTNDENPRVSVLVHFYDEDKKFISSTEAITADVEVEAVEGAEYARLEVVPNEGEDDDNEISYFEMLDFVKELKVSVNK